MIKSLILNLVGISVVSGTAAGVLIAVRSIFANRKGKRISSKWMCICWLVLALRLLIPFNLPISLFNVENLAGQISEGASDVSEIQQFTDTIGNTVQTHEEKSVDFISAAFCIWIAGAVLFILRQLVIYFSERRRMKRWSRKADSNICAKAERIAENIGIHRKFVVLCCERKISPMLMGVIKPVLFIPAGISDNQLETALLHELTHLKRQDILFKIIITLSNGVHWFNPFVWLMAKEAEKDAESACDEAVLMGADRAARRVYCDTILDMMSGRRIPFATALTYKKEDIMKRFKNILDTSKRKSGLVLAIILVCICTVFCGLVGCSAADGNVQEEAAAVQEVTTPSTTAQEEAKTESTTRTTETAAESIPEETVDISEGEMNAQTAMELVNEYRVQNGLPELLTDDAGLKNIAQIRLAEAKEQFSHTRPNGQRYISVFGENGLTYTVACENLARGQIFAGQTVNDWKNSEIHNINLLNPEVTHMYIACSEGEFEGYPYVYWIYLAYRP